MRSDRARLRIEKVLTRAQAIAGASSEAAKANLPAVADQWIVQAVYDRGRVKGLQEAWEIVCEEEGN